MPQFDPSDFKNWQTNGPGRDSVAPGQPPSPPPGSGAPTKELTFMQKLRSGLSEHPQGIPGKVAAEALPMAGALTAGALTGAATRSWPAASAAAAAGGAAGEQARQGIGMLTGDYPPKADPIAALKTGAAYGLGEGLTRGAFGVARLAGDAIEGIGGRTLMPAVAEGGAPNINYEHIQRLKARPNEVLDKFNMNEYAPASRAKDFKDAVTTTLDKAKQSWNIAKDQLISKFGDKPVVDIKGLDYEMSKVVQDYGLKMGSKLDEPTIQYVNKIIQDATPGKDMVTAQEAFDMVKRFNREIKFGKTKTLDPNVNLDESLINSLKEKYYERVDKGMGKSFSKLREEYGGIRQLERDAAPILNAKDMPKMIEQADARINSDHDVLNQIVQKFPETGPALEKVRDSVAAQSFRRPISNLFGNTYGYTAKAASVSAEELAKFLSSTTGGSLDAMAR